MNLKSLIKMGVTSLALSLSTLLSAETITFANGEWAPYMSPKLKNAGYVSDIVVQAYKEEGIDVKWVFLPWKRGFEEAKNGAYQGTAIWGYNEERAKDFDVKWVFLPWKRGFEEAKNGAYQGTAIWGYNEERAKDFLYTDTVLNLETAFFIQKDSDFFWNTISDLKGKKLGGIIGYAYGIEDAEKAGDVKISRISKPEGNYKKLAAGRLDAVLEDTQVGLKSIHKMGYDGKIVPYSKPLKSRKYSVIISKQVPNAERLIKAFNKGLKKLQDSGRFDAILKAARDGEYDQP